MFFYETDERFLRRDRRYNNNQEYDSEVIKQLDKKNIINQNIEMLVMKVVKEGMCSYSDVKEGKIDYEDIINMNDYLTLKQDLEAEAIAIERKKNEQDR